VPENALPEVRIGSLTIVGIPALCQNAGIVDS
jgi:hypothetical protein